MVGDFGGVFMVGHLLWTWCVCFAFVGGSIGCIVIWCFEGLLALARVQRVLRILLGAEVTLVV